MVEKTSASEVPAGTSCADCENAPATRCLSDKDGKRYVCGACYETSFVEGIPAPESFDNDSQYLEG